MINCPIPTAIIQNIHWFDVGISIYFSFSTIKFGTIFVLKFNLNSLDLGFVIKIMHPPLISLNEIFFLILDGIA